MAGILKGFSKLTRKGKIEALIQSLQLQENMNEFLDQFRFDNADVQKLLDELSENTLTNFPTPYGIAPNFLINNKVYHIPMVTEESSVVAAASKAAKIWSALGGFHATVKSTTKIGQVHFIWNGNPVKLNQAFPALEQMLLKQVLPLTESMQKRGGGIKRIELIDKTNDIPGYFQLFVCFDTADAMGANFINTCLEALADGLSRCIPENTDFSDDEKKVEILMSILSNYNPDCIVETYVECPIEELKNIYPSFSPLEYARRFKMAVDISKSDVYRATTHNKGIFNGIDAVAIATGNDYRAIEAGAHAFASRNGNYQGLSSVHIEHGKFRVSLELPLAVGTVGGITAVHPLAKLSLRILDNPNAKELMMIIASAGLASNFSAIHALITSGIQKGHMKMHLSNILNQLNASEKQKELVNQYFKDKVVTFSKVEKYLKVDKSEVNDERNTVN